VIPAESFDDCYIKKLRSEIMRAHEEWDGLPRAALEAKKVKITGLAQNLDQLQAFNMDFQPNWANLKILGRPCDFQVQAPARPTRTEAAAAAIHSLRSAVAAELSHRTVWALPGRLSALRVFHGKPGFVWHFGMGAQGAEQPKTAVLGPGR
jgi:hypothetical protein